MRAFRIGWLVIVAFLALDLGYGAATDQSIWLYSDSGGGRIFDRQTYTYCPNKGMVRAVQ